MSADRDAIVKRFRQLPGYIEALVRHLNYEQLTTVYIKDQWTIAQNVHHLADSQSALFFRFKLLLLQDNPTVQPFDQDDWANTAEATSADVMTSISILRGLHHRWADLIESLSDEEWIRPGHHPETGQLTVGGIASYASNHGYVHIDQINQVLAAQGDGEEA